MGSMRTLIAGVLCAATASAKILEGEKPCVLPDGWDLVGNPELCRRIRFTCPEGMEVFTGHECGCGCKPKPCELPDGWVLKGTPEQCPLIRFVCPAGMEYFGGHKCGCGCKPKEEKPCVLPKGWDLVGNPEQCRRIRFKCPDDMEIFTGHECGCGCKPKACELPDGWVLKGTPEQCPLIRFTCPPGMEYFGGHKCGCGCKPAIVERCPRGYVREGDDCVTEEGRCSYPKIDMIVVGGAAFVDPVTGQLTSSRSVRCGTWDECTWQWAVRGPSSCTIFAP